ncbi:head-tail adaptor protein [Pseudoroseicyclus sp. CXY001]|uniref:head-tail adaptor protein n=1 Tax=Pseudoroseicyclus sp. CXY001 TaxID=3242492 RepID=UPI0035712140
MTPRLNRSLVLEAPERASDGAGGYTEGWAVRGTLWAEIASGSLGAAAGGGAPLARRRVKITVRAAPFGAPSRPEPGQRLREGARVFRILSVAEAENAQRYLTLLTEEERLA